MAYKESEELATQQTERWERVATAFVSARRKGIALAAYPGPTPDTLDDAYAIQAQAIRLRGGAIGGWKIGRINPTYTEHYGANRLTGPIFADQIKTAPAIGDNPAMPVIAAGFAAAEAEILLRIGRLPDESHPLDDVRDLIDQVAVGIEIASSPLAAINDLGPAVTASDFGNNHGLLIGPSIVGWHDLDFDSITVVTAINGHEVGRATTATMLDGPWGAARFLMRLARKQQLPIAPGQWISTGAVTGVHPVLPGDTVHADFGTGLQVGCVIGIQQDTDQAESIDGNAERGDQPGG